jgi:hypothetical protein
VNRGFDSILESMAWLASLLDRLKVADCLYVGATSFRLLLKTVSLSGSSSALVIQPVVLKKGWSEQFGDRPDLEVGWSNPRARR